MGRYKVLEFSTVVANSTLNGGNYEERVVIIYDTKRGKNALIISQCVREGFPSDRIRNIAINHEGSVLITGLRDDMTIAVMEETQVSEMLGNHPYLLDTEIDTDDFGKIIRRYTYYADDSASIELKLNF